MKVPNRAQIYADVIKFTVSTKMHGTSLPILSAVVTEPGLVLLLAGSKGADELFQIGKAERRRAYGAQRDAKEAAQTWIGIARDVLVPFLSRSWNERWAQAGWIAPGSLATPDSIPQILDLLDRLERFLKKNSRFENAEPDVNVTAVKAKALHVGLDQAVKDVSTAKSGQRTRGETREAADSVMWEKVQAGRKALEIEIKPEDPRWLDFINQVPADLDRPEVPEGVEVEPGLPGRLTVRCEPSERAESYEVEVLVVGQDQAFRSVAVVQDPVANLSLPPGSRVKVRMFARNSTGSSVASEVVEATVPRAVAA